MLAPPLGFSQLATSFLAWLRLGIPRTLLPRLVCPCIQLHKDDTPGHDPTNEPRPEFFT
jgi:hypothetical protein